MMGDSSPYLYVSGNDLVDHWRLTVQEKESTGEGSSLHSTSTQHPHVSDAALRAGYRALNDPHRSATPMSFHSGVSSGEGMAFDRCETV